MSIKSSARNCAMYYSDDPNDYSVDTLEKCLHTAAELVIEHGYPAWLFQVVENALEHRKRDDVRARAAALLLSRKTAPRD